MDKRKLPFDNKDHKTFEGPIDLRSNIGRRRFRLTKLEEIVKKYLELFKNGKSLLDEETNPLYGNFNLSYFYSCLL